jgi:adenylate cyclase
MATSSTALPSATGNDVTYTLVFKERGLDKRLDLPRGPTVVGRANTCDLVLSHTSISRTHARFLVEDGRCLITDLGSRNGTYVNGSQIETAMVADGDRLVLGRFRITMRCSLSEAVVLTSDTTFAGAVVRAAQDTGAVASAPTIDARRSLQLLSEISRTLIGAQPIDAVLGHVVELAFNCTHAQRALLLLYDASTKELVPRVVRHRNDAQGSTRLSRTILDRVLRDRVSMLAIDAQVDPRLATSQSIMALETRSFMCAPLWHDREIIGVLYVDNPTTERFTVDDLDLFTAFSNYAAVAIAQARLVARVQEEVRRRERLERYHSPAVVDRILETGPEDDASFIAQERDLTVLFADLVGFTAIAEGRRPQELAALLNVFFSRMADAIFEHEGTLDKFIGDSVLAVFGAPLSLPNHALSAVRAAQSMQRALTALGAERPDPPLQMRIAIHTGLAMVGDIGSLKRRDFTVLGDVVNTAARMEESAVGAGQIVITRATCDRLGDQVQTRSLGSMQFRGQTTLVDLFEVL